MSYFSSAYDVNDPKVTKTIEKEMNNAFEKESYFVAMSGKSDNSPIKSKYNSQAGLHTLKFLNSLTGAGVRDNADFDTNEDELSRLSMSVKQHIVGNSVKSQDKRFEENVHGNHFNSDAVAALNDWDVRVFDRHIFASLSHNCTSISAFSRKEASGLYTIEEGKSTQDLCSQIEASDTFNLKSFRAALRNAKRGIDHFGKKHPKLRPYRIEMNKVKDIPIKMPVLIALLHPSQIASLQDDPDFKEIQKQNVRGEDNPLISGQIGMIDGCIIADASEWEDETLNAGILTCDVKNIDAYLNEQEFVARGGILPISAYAGKDSTQTAIGLLIGAGALMITSDFKSNPVVTPFDGGRKVKISSDRMYGMRKTHYVGYTPKEQQGFYHGKDFSCMALVSAI